MLVPKVNDSATIQKLEPWTYSRNRKKNSWKGERILKPVGKRLWNSRNSERWRENPKGNKEIWKSREMSEVVFMKVFSDFYFK